MGSEIRRYNIRLVLSLYCHMMLACPVYRNLLLALIVTGIYQCFADYPLKHLIKFTVFFTFSRGIIVSVICHTSGQEINFFFLIATWLLNFSKWQPFQKKLVAIFKGFFSHCRPSKINSGKRSLTCYKVDTKMDEIQPSSSPKSKMASSYCSRCMCHVLETNLTRKFAMDLSLQIFLIYYIPR